MLFIIGLAGMLFTMETDNFELALVFAFMALFGFIRGAWKWTMSDFGSNSINEITEQQKKYEQYYGVNNKDDD